MRELADEKDPLSVNEVAPPAKHEISEAAQESHEATLADFNTFIKDGLRRSLNGITSPQEIETFLKGENKKNE